MASELRPVLADLNQLFSVSMNSNPSPSSSGSELLPANSSHRAHFCRSVSWAAIFAGLSAALALQVLFTLLGAGLGFAIYSPLTDANPIADLGAGAVIIQGFSAVFSLWFGGWVAGRFTPAGIRATGWLHGFSVWCAATVAGILFVSVGAGWALGDLSKIVGGGLSLAGRPAAALAGSAADLAKDAVRQSGDALNSFIDEAVSNRPADSTKNLSIRAKREVGLAVARLFNPAPQANLRANRAAVIKALVDYTGMSEADADQAVTDWTATYDQLKADFAAAKNVAETKARETADQAAKALAVISLCAFAAFLFGAVAASFGGHHGAKCALKCEGRTEPAD
jgi:hypothetical protein